MKSTALKSQTLLTNDICISLNYVFLLYFKYDINICMEYSKNHENLMLLGLKGIGKGKSGIE
jgi:hypothetical protein